jgi:hypothetical protein
MMAEQRAKGTLAGATAPPLSPSRSRMLASYLAHIEHLLGGRRWQAARREAFDLPQIAVALSDPQLRSSPQRVRQWCQEWVLTGCCVGDPERLGPLDTAESVVPAEALKRLRLHRLARTAPQELSAALRGSPAHEDAEAALISTRLVDATRRWYARSACRDATVQSNLARLAVLR